MAADVRCPACGEKNPPGVQSCQKCNQPLAGRVCPHCGQGGLRPAARFCKHCGRSLDVRPATEAASSPQAPLVVENQTAAPAADENIPALQASPPPLILPTPAAELPSPARPPEAAVQAKAGERPQVSEGPESGVQMDRETVQADGSLRAPRESEIAAAGPVAAATAARPASPTLRAPATMVMWGAAIVIVMGFGIMLVPAARERIAALQAGPTTQVSATPQPTAPPQPTPATQPPLAPTPQVDSTPVPPAPAVAPPPPLPSLKIASAPSGAQVDVDGVPVGTTELTLKDVKPGTHMIRISKAGYRTVIREILMEEGQVVVLDITMTPAPPPPQVRTPRAPPPPPPQAPEPPPPPPPGQ